MRILCIDPGSQCCGVSVIDWNLSTQTGTVIFSKTLTGKEAYGKLNQIHMDTSSMPDVQKRLIGYSIMLRDILGYYRPNVVVVESPFMGSFAQTFKVLTEMLMHFELETRNYNYSCDFIRVDPPTVKKNMGVKGNSSDKEEMRAALKSCNDLSYVDEIRVDMISEHEVDSICIGRWFIESFLRR